MNSTGRHILQDEMRFDKQWFQALVEHSSDVVVFVNRGGIIDYINPAIKQVLGFTPEERMGEKGFDNIHPDDIKFIMESFVTLIGDPQAPPIEGVFRLRHKDGSWRFIEGVGSNLVRNNRVEGVILNYRDVTERKKAEDKYRHIFENAQEGIYQSTPEGRFITVNNAMARILGYDSPEDLIACVTDIATQIYVNPDERVKILEMMHDRGSLKQQETQFRRKDGRMIWVSRTIHIVRDEEGKVLHYEGILEDITERKENIERLRKALDGTVKAIASIVETRDPYTAGHQRRVGYLARAIAESMGLPKEQIEGLRIAAIIHDIGKISVPSEILSKPSKLTAIEFDLIKIHSQAGYDILKDIEFPWPVANIVYEHHERMNGSGYPRNLKGNEILLEGRILAVADVVEAMASHRPYRASLGIEKALEEIEKNKGILYDIAVIDTCIRLFRQKGFQISFR